MSHITEKFSVQRRHTLLSVSTFAMTALAAAATAALVAQAQVEGGVPTAKPQAVEAEAVLQVPAVDYRKEWVQLGSFSLLADKPADGAKQIHVVYTARQS